MGLILAPLLLLLLAGLLLGVPLAWRTIRASSDKLRKALLLAALTASVHVLAFGAMFVLNRGERVAMFSLFFGILVVALAVLAAGGVARRRFKRTGDARTGIVAAALLLAAGLVPFSFFYASTRLAAALGITYSY
ncbi:MAG TPA: hypothetical protein VHL79_21275 [Ramlibacter sp.]|nr:hypothetical protein [Ramlibacter sp.]